jgi:hypothetical protein
MKRLQYYDPIEPYTSKIEIVRYITSAHTSHYVILLVTTMRESDLPTSHFLEAIRRPTAFPLLYAVVRNHDSVSTHS